MKLVIRNKSFFFSCTSLVRKMADGEITGVKNKKDSFDNFGKIPLRRNVILSLLFVENDEFFFTTTLSDPHLEACSLTKEELLKAINKGKVEVLELDFTV